MQGSSSSAYLLKPSWDEKAKCFLSHSPAMITFFISGSFRKNTLCLCILFGWETSFADYFISIISSLPCQLLFFRKLWERRISSLFVTGNKQPFHMSLCFRKQSWLYYSPTCWILNVGSLGCKGASSALPRVESMVKCLTKVSENFNPVMYKSRQNSRAGFTVYKELPHPHREPCMTFLFSTGKYRLAIF